MRHILKNFECFDSDSDACLKVDQNSNLYCVVFGQTRYIAWEKIDFVTLLDDDMLEFEKSYYSVIDGEEVLRMTEYKRLHNSEITRNRFVFLLSDMMKMKKGEVKYLSRKCVEAFNTRKRSKTKVKKI